MSSFDALAQVKNTTYGTPTRKLLMLALASYVDEAWSCFPSQETLAADTEMGERTVRRLLAELEAEGYLRRTARMRSDGRGRTSDRIYVVRRSPATVAGPDDQPANGARPTGQRVQDQPATVAGEHPEELPGEPPGEKDTARVGTSQLALVPTPPRVAHPAGQGMDLAWLSFWQVWPNKRGKHDARKAWGQVLREGFDPAVIVAGARRYAADPNLPEQRYQPHPATWLRGHRWEDEAEPDRQARATALHGAAGTMAALREVQAGLGASMVAAAVPTAARAAIAAATRAEEEAALAESRAHYDDPMEGVTW